MKRKNFLRLVGLIVFVPLQGCTSLLSVRNKNEVIYRAAVKLAALKVINNDFNRAMRVEHLALFAQGLSIDPEIPASQIEEKLRARLVEVDWSDEIKIILNELITVLRDNIKEKIDKQELDPDYKVLISETANLILEATFVVLNQQRVARHLFLNSRFGKFGLNPTKLG